MRVIGTAGHVDHGKSTLVKRLTGIDPDRLSEEKARGLTIDIGFGWFDLPNGETVGVVDVPGHRDFIENMLAGVGGIDMALLVIAADEGVMPQTQEHLAILDLLGISVGLLVITKVDLIDDNDWLDLVELEIYELVNHTFLEDAPIIRVSATANIGIDKLYQHIASLLVNSPPHTDYHQPRLPIDRVFTIDGFGTVVTGTLTGGSLNVGDTIELQPNNTEARIRGLQSYQKAIDTASPGSRVAINLTGINKEFIKRGDVLAYPNQLKSTQLIDVYFHHLPDIDRPLKHNAEVKFFAGASETIARVRLLSDEVLQAGASGWLQLRLNDALPLSQHERFILRYPSPAETIGGGSIINPHPEQRWKRFNQEAIHNLEVRLQGTASERVIQAANMAIPQKYVHLQKNTTLDDTELDAAINEALGKNQLIHLPDDTFWSTEQFQLAKNTLIATVKEYHQNNPLRLGISREELRNRLNIKHNLLTILLGMQSDLVAADGIVKDRNHDIQFSKHQKEQIDTLLKQFSERPFTPPSYKECLADINDELLHALIDTEVLIQISDEVIYLNETYQEMIVHILSVIDIHGEIDVKRVRDELQTSRKYAIALLEHLDAIKVTKRVGDVRVRV